MKQIHEHAGIVSGASLGLDIATLEKVIEDDFNPEDYDSKMNLLFGGDYYENDAVKPVFDDDLADIQDEEDEDIYDTDNEEEQIEEEVVGDTMQEDSKVDETQLKLAKEKVSELSKTLEEYYKLDHEDMVYLLLIYSFRLMICQHASSTAVFQNRTLD